MFNVSFDRTPLLPNILNSTVHTVDIAPQVTLIAHTRTDIVADRINSVLLRIDPSMDLTQL
jgi:hypothetical protein